MPEKDVLFSISLPDGTKTTLNQEQYSQAQDKLFAKFPDAQVARVQSYVGEDEDEDQNDTDSYRVQLPDGTSTTLDATQFAANRQRLQEKFPDAQIARISDMSDRYWRPKLDEAKAALDAFNQQNGQTMSKYEMLQGIENNTPGNLQWIYEHQNEYNTLSQQKSALQEAISTNPIVRRGRQQAYDNASALREKYLSMAEKAESGAERRDWKRAAKLQGDAAELFGAPSQFEKREGQSGFEKYLSDYKAGAVNTFSDRDFWTRGITQIARDLDLRGIQKKVQEEEKRKGAALDERDFDRILSPSEKAELMSFYALAQAEYDDVIGRAGDLPSAYRAGQGAAESAGFMAEFLLSTGLANVAGKAMSASANGLTRWLGQALMSDKALSRAVGKGVTTIPQMSKAAKVGTELARPMVQGLWHTGTQLSTLSNIASMMNQTDDEGELNSVAEGIWLGLADSFVENWSESLGNTMDKGFDAGLSWAGGKLGGSALGKTSFGRMARWAYNSPFNQTLKEAGFNGFIGEMLEEWAGNAVRLGTGLMDKDEFNKFASVEQQLEMAASFAPMSIFGLGGNVVSGVRHKKEYDRLAEKVKGILMKDGVSQAEIDDLFNTRFDTGEDVAKKLAPYANNVLNSGNESAKNDYATILQFAKEAGIDSFNEAMAEMRNQEQRNEMQSALAAKSGQFWQEYGPVEEGGAPVEAVHVVRYADGTRKYIVEGIEQAPSGVRMYATVDENGNKGFINDLEIQNGLEDGTITANEEMGLNEYLQQQVDAVKKDAEAVRMQREVNNQLAAIKARISANPSFNMGTPEQPKMATVVPATINAAGAIVEVDAGEGAAPFEAQLTWKEIGEYLGMPIEAKTDEQMENDAAAAQQEAIARKDKYNAIPAGTQITVTLPGAEGDEKVPYRFAKAIYDENEGQVRIYVADENGNILTGRDGEEVWFPEEMVEGIDAVADESIAKANTPVEEEAAPAVEEAPAVAPVQKYTNADGKVNQTAFFKNEPEEWAKWNDARRNDGGANTKERLAASISGLEKEIAELNKKKAATANPDDAETLEDSVNELNSRYNTLKSIYDQYIAAEQAAKAAEDEARRAEFEAAAAAKKAAEQKAAAKIQDDLKEDASFVELAENYAEQPKTYGDTDTYNVGGRKFKGRWVVAEATTPKPSHNPLNGFAPTPGYPIGKAGNSNHYDKDKRAQEITREMSNPFDERAVQEPVVVTKHGIVLSGNGRTQARLLAAQQQTDTDYEQYIKEHASKWGLTAEEIDQYQNPILYFELEEDVEYTAALFDAFNRSTSKQQSVTETAAKVAQMTSDELVMRLDRLFREIGDNIDNLYKNPQQVNELLNMLQAAGIFNANERARFVDEYGNLSGAGEDLVESVLFGTIFSSSDESVRAAMNDKAIRRAVAFAFPTLVRLRNLNGEYTMANELGEAVSLVAAAKAANGGKAENAVIDYMLQGDLFTGETPMVKATVQLLAHVLNDGKYGSLRSVLNQYIERAEMANYGQADMFGGDVETKEQILRDVLAHNNINIEVYGNQAESAGQPGVPADDAVRPASGEQGSSGNGADASGAEHLEGVPGEGTPAAEGEPVDPLKVAKEQAAKNRLAKKLQKRIAKWKKFLGDGAFEFASGIEDIEKIEDAATREQVLQRQQQYGDVEGWFANGKAVIYLPNIPDTRTLDRKIMHEVIAHKGIKGLFEGKGKGEFDKFLDWTWGNLMNEATRSYYMNYPGVAKIGDMQKRQRAAADEFLAHCAEKETAVIAEVDDNFWSRLVEALKNFINDAMGEDVFDTEDGWFADLLKQAAQSVQEGAAPAQQEEDNTLFGIKEVDSIPNEMEEGNVLFSVGDGGLVGMHNISERKLRSAIRTGGLANPSLAVIDVDNMIHEDYGDISLLAPSSLIDTRKGRNAGTYNGDAWTPTYPGVRKKMSDKGWKEWQKAISSLPEPIRHDLRSDWEEWLDRDYDRRSIYWWFLQDTGRNPEIVYNSTNLSPEDRAVVESLSDGVYSSDENTAKAVDLYRRLTYPEDVKHAEHKFDLSNAKEGRHVDYLRERNEEVDKYGIWMYPVEKLVSELTRDLQREGTMNEYATYDTARKRMEEENLLDEFNDWIHAKEEEFGVKEVLFAGWTPDGDKKYVPNTVGNASRLMNKESGQNAYNDGGVSATRSLLLERMTTLSQIRKNRSQMADIRGYASETPEYEQARDNWFNVIHTLSDMKKIDDNPFSNIDYAESRLQEAIMESNPIAYLNREYKYNIPEDGEFAEALKASLKEIKSLPAKYFETKFNRPVYLNEFAAAVIPTNTAEGVRKELEKAGLPIYEYDSKKEGARQEAVLQASQVDGVRFSVGDYQSGEAQEQYRQQLENTPEFKEWFKGSKVVDENGNPLVVYRGATFDPLAMADGLGVIKPQAYFSPSKEYARRYGPWTRSYYLNIQNPFDIRNKKDLEIYKRMLPDGYVIAKTGSGAADWAEFGAAIDIDTLMDNHPEYDGIILDEGGDPDGNGGVTSRGVSYIPLRGGAQVKSAEANNGQFSPENPDVRFSVITPEQDAEYMKAVEDGDMEKARQMVDEAAKAAGYNMHAYHGSDQEFTTFKHRRAANGRIWGQGFYFAESEEEAARWGDRAARANGGWKSNVIDAFLSVHNPVEVTSFDGSFVTGLPGEVVEQILPELDAEYDADILEAFNTGYLEDFDNSKTDRISEILEELGYDAVVGDYYGESHIKVFSPNQIKSAEPVTVDNEGKVIPLSQRFNEDNEDIRFSVRRYHNFATAQQENKVPGKEYPELEDASVRFSLSKNNRATVEAWLRKRGDITDEQRQAVVDYLDTLSNPTLQLATAKWFSQGVVRLPEDMDKVEQAVSVAGKAKVDPLQYNSPMELLDAHAGFEASEKRIDPNTVPTLHKVKEFKDHGIVIYDVEDNEGSRQNMRKIINSHFGKEASPWCLLQGDGNGNLTKESAQYWRSYNAYPKQVCFLNGKLLAFSANDTKRVVWWDRQDKPYEGIPVTRKMFGDELGRSATYTLDEDGLLSNPTNIHRGNKQNGTYEEWDSDGALIIRRNYKNGKRHGLDEAFYYSGKPYIREEFKDGAPVGKYLNWFENGQLRMEYNYSEDGFSDGEQLEYYEDGSLKYRGYRKRGLRDGVEEEWNANGVQTRRAEYKNGKRDGVTETWNGRGEPESYIEYKEGKQEGLSKAWHWNGELAREAQYHDGHLVGESKAWYESGNIREISQFDENGKLDGVQERYFDFVGREVLAERLHYEHGIKEGLYEKWHDKDIPAARAMYANDHKVGLEERWFDNGVLAMRTTYDENGVENGVQERWDSGGKLWDRHEMVDGKEGRFLGTWPQESVYGDVKFSVVTDENELARLNSEPTITLYRAMELIDGKLYPPMSQKIPNAKSDKGKKMQRREGVVPGMWQKSDEDPSKAYQKEEGGPWYYDLKKTKGSDVNGVLYNPYLHLSASPLNDQFSAASTRPNLVTVACEVPISELTSGYKAEKANDSVGAKDWHSGTVTAQLGNGRQVVLSRWAKISRIVPDTEVAAMVAPGIVEKNIYVPVNVVTPSLRAALEARGVKFAEPVAEGDVKFSIQNRVFRAQERRPGESSASYGMRLAYTFDNVYHKGAAGWITAPRREDTRGDMAYSKTSKKIVIFVGDEMPKVSEMEMLFFHESLHAWIDKLSDEEKQALLSGFGEAKFAPEESMESAREKIRKMGYKEDDVPEEYLTYMLSQAMSIGKVPVVQKSMSGDGHTILDNILKNIDYNVEQETERRVQSRADRVRESNAGDAGERAGVRNALDERGREEGEVRFAVANRNQEIFVSNAERAAESIKMDKATPTQWIAMLEKAGGLKAGEDKWLGLSDWLKASDKKTITKQEILEFIDQNRILIEETHYSEESADDYQQAIESYQEEYAKFVEEGVEQNEPSPYEYAFDQMVERYGDDFEMAFERDGDSISPIESWDGNGLTKAAEYFIEERKKNSDKFINPTRLDYTTEGLDNKREIALTVPTIESWNEGDNIHFGDAGEGRAVAWIRFGDSDIDAGGKAAAQDAYRQAEDAYKAYKSSLRQKYGSGILDYYEKATDAEREQLNQLKKESERLYREYAYGSFDKKRVLFIDEIQSKRHQEGREKGYSKRDLFVGARIGEYEKRTTESGRKVMSAPVLSSSGEIIGRITRTSDGWFYGELANGWETSSLPSEDKIIEQLNILSNRDGIPAAPFEKNWHELAMKRMLRLAAEEGYDYVAWTTGAQQAERYNLKKMVSEIAARADGNGNYYVVIEDKQGFELSEFSGSGKKMTANDMVSYFGKDLAIRLMTGADQSRGKEWSGKGNNPEFFTVRGDDLQVGGEGMKGFYDDILVRFVNKYAKKWGASVKDDLVTLSGGALIEAHTLPVTQEMKDSVMEGQVMFSVRAAADARRDGIGAVIGKENVSDFYMTIYGAMTPEMRKDVVEKTMGSSLDFVDALQEYVSNVAAKGYQNDDTGILLVAENLLNYYSDETINPYAAQYILWRGNRGVNENDLLDVAHDQFMWNYLKVEDYPDNPDDTPDGPGKGSIEAAREETDTNPSDAQKEAGNYKHGHVSIDGYNISLENPKGSVRSGKDASGKEWSVTMNNDYGYIRMTEGTDGDHIDVFLSDNPDQGNVYVVDQVDPKSGEFDEHKVMYGFNSEDEAREAYLSNYSEGWKGLGAITGVTKDEFKKWIESSHRKTKPFADYKSVRFSVSDSMNEADKAAEAAIDEAQERLKQDKKDLKDILTAAKAMALQKTYDKSTVETVTNLAKRILKDQYVDALSRREVARLLGIVRTSVGKSPKTVKKNADAIVEMVIDNLLKREKQGLEAMLKTTGTKTNATGVEVQAELDVQGQKTLKAFKEGLKQEIGTPEDDETMSTLYGLRARLADRLSSKDDATRKEAEAEDAGLALAIDYKENVKSLLDEEDDLLSELKDLAAALKDGNISKSNYNESVRATEDALRENHIEQVEAHRDFRHKLQEMLSGSADARRAFADREKERLEAIHHLANSDMQGRSADTEKKPTFADKLANSPVTRFFMAPLQTFDQMLRLFGGKSVDGRGYLWNKYMTGWQEATEKAYIGQRDAKKRLDEKASEVFGEGKKWADIFDEERRMPTVTVKWRGADGEMKEHELTQGQMLYIYMVNKMADGRMKLRRMGIEEEDVQAIRRVLDDRFVEIADWLQEEFLVDLRNKYNAVHERLFGASMAAIENYFPLVINKRDLNRNEDIAALDYESLPSTTTGSIIKRRRNSKALDLLNADAFSVILNHIDQMEQWAAFAEFNKDVNALLSYKRFRNQVQNMASVYGSGTELWKNFKDVARIAGNAYHPDIKRSSLDTAAVNLAKGVTSAKISFRVYTAIKQLLSMPAFISDANVARLAANMANPIGAWKWAMNNLPLFEKRWSSRIAGDTRLMTTDMDWKVFRSKVYDKLSKLGMTPNAFVDAVTVAVGAHAIYQTKYNQYVKEGFTEEQADKKAKQDATVLYNETQQSNENAFLSPVQLDRTLFATAITVFRNSSMGFQRQLHDAVRNLGKMLAPGYKNTSIEFMTKQLEREGLSPEQAKDAAEKRYGKAFARNAVRAATFGFLVQFAWNLGGSLAYLLLGDDDDEKEEMLREAFVHALIGGPIEGLAGGNVLSEAINMVAKGENLTKYDPTLLPVLSDMKRIYSMMSYDNVAAWNEVFNLATQALVGVNPQTFEDAVVAVIDACEGDPETSKEAMLLIMRVMQVPQSQIDKVYIDELGMSAEKARMLTPQQMAKRYARYKLMRNAGEWTPVYSDEQREKRLKTYEKSFNKKVKERKELKKK